jgi:hypothetical protein
MLDGRKLLVVMIILAVTLTVESQVGTIADFILEELASISDIAGFIVIWVSFMVTQYYILALLKHNYENRRVRTRFLGIVHRIVSVVQFLLAGITAIIILQILLAQEYDTVMLYIVLFISYGLWIITLGFLAKAFFSWYRSSQKNIMVLIFALSMVAYVINGIFGLYTQINDLTRRSPIIKSGDVAIFPESPSWIDNVYQMASSFAYVLTWIATVMLLRPYIEKLGKLKFWSVMGATMAYYLVQFPLFALGYFTPSENSSAITNMLLFSLSAVFTGILFGAAFLSVAKTLKLGTAGRNYMIVAAYGFLLFLHRWLCYSFSSFISTIWSYLCFLYRIILLFDIQWALFFSDFSFSGHFIETIN